MHIPHLLSKEKLNLILPILFLAATVLPSSAVTTSSDLFTGWTHIVVVYTSATITFYKDGVELDSRANTAGEPPVVARSLNYFGKSSSSADPDLDGTISYFRMWEGLGLDAAQVEFLYA